MICTMGLASCQRIHRSEGHRSTRNEDGAVQTRRHHHHGRTASDADTLEKIIRKWPVHQTERGNREDDKRSESAMEDRKRQGYF